MFSDILVPLDGTRAAEGALPMAARLARLSKARLHLVCIREPTMVPVGAGVVRRPSAQLQARVDREHAYLVKTAAALRLSAGAPVGFHLVEGYAGPEICEEAACLDAGLVVIATHGEGPLPRLWLPSVADYVVRHLTTPVLLVPGDWSALPQGDGRAGGILVAMDLSKDAEAILEPVTQLSQLADAHVTLIHVVGKIVEASKLTDQKPALADAAQLVGARRDAQRQLDRVADRLRERGVSVSSRVVTGPDAAACLLKVLDESRYAFLAMTSHGEGGLPRLLLGRVADKVVRSVRKPLLIFRPPPRIPTGETQVPSEGGKI